MITDFAEEVNKSREQVSCLESEPAQGGHCCADWALEPWGAVGWQRMPHCLGELGAGPGKAGKWRGRHSRHEEGPQ